MYRYVIGEIDQPGILPNSNRESRATGRFHRRLGSGESNRNSLDISCDSLDTKFSFTHLLKDQVGRGKKRLSPLLFHTIRYTLDRMRGVEAKGNVIPWSLDHGIIYTSVYL